MKISSCRRRLLCGERIRGLAFSLLALAIFFNVMFARGTSRDEGVDLDMNQTSTDLAPAFPQSKERTEGESFPPDYPIAFPAEDPFLRVERSSAQDSDFEKRDRVNEERRGEGRRQVEGSGVLHDPRGAEEEERHDLVESVSSAHRSSLSRLENESNERPQGSVRNVGAPSLSDGGGVGGGGGGSFSSSSSSSQHQQAPSSVSASQRGRQAGNTRGRKGGSVRFGASYTLSLPPSLERTAQRKANLPTNRYTYRRKGNFGGSRFSFKALREAAIWLGAVQRKTECLLLIAIVVVFLAKYSSSRTAFEDGTRLAALSSMEEAVQRLTQLLEIGEDIANAADRQCSSRQVDAEAPDPAASIADIMREFVLILDAHRARAVKEEQEARLAFHVRAAFPNGGPAECMRSSFELTVAGFEAANAALRRARPHFLSLAARAESAAEAARADAQAVGEGISKLSLDAASDKALLAESAAQQAATAAAEVRESVSRLYRQESKAMSSPADLERAAKQFQEVRITFRAFEDALMRCHTAASTASRLVDEVSSFCIAREVGRAERAAQEASRATARARQDLDKFADVKSGNKQTLEHAELLAARAAAHVQEVEAAPSAEVASERASAVCNIADMALFAINKVTAAARSGDSVETTGDSLVRRANAVKKTADSVRLSIGKVQLRIDALPKKAKDRPGTADARREARRCLVELKRADEALEKTYGTARSATASSSGGDALCDVLLQDAQNAVFAAEKAASRASSKLEEEESRSKRESVGVVVDAAHSVASVEREVRALRELLEETVSSSPDAIADVLAPFASAIRVASDQIHAISSKADALQLRTLHETDASAADSAVNEVEAMISEVRVASSHVLLRASEAADRVREALTSVASEAEQASTRAIEEAFAFKSSRVMAELADLSMHIEASSEAFKALEEMEAHSPTSLPDATLHLRVLLAKAGPLHAAASACKAAALTLERKAMEQRVSFAKELLPRAEALMMRLDRLGLATKVAQKWKSFADATESMADLREAARESDAATSFAEATAAASKASYAFNQLQSAVEETQRLVRLYARVSARTQMAVAAAEAAAESHVMQHRTEGAAERVRRIASEFPENLQIQRLWREVHELEKEVRQNALEATDSVGAITAAATSAHKMITEFPSQLPDDLYQSEAECRRHQERVLEKMMRTKAIATLALFKAEAADGLVSSDKHVSLPPLMQARLDTQLNASQVLALQDAVEAAANETDSPSLKQLVQTIRTEAVSARAAAESLRTASEDSKFSDMLSSSAVEIAYSRTYAIIKECSYRLPALVGEAAEATAAATKELTEVLDEVKEITNIPAAAELIERLENARVNAAIEGDSASRAAAASAIPTSLVHAGALLKSAMTIRDQTLKSANAARAAAREGRAFLLGLEIGRARAAASAAHLVAEQAKEIAEASSSLVPKGFMAIERALKDIQVSAQDAAEAARLAFAFIKAAEAAFTASDARKAREEAELLQGRAESGAAIAASNMSVLLSRQREVPLLGSIDKYVLEAANAAKDAAMSGESADSLSEKASESPEVARLKSELHSLVNEASTAAKECAQGASEIRSADTFPELLAALQRTVSARNRANAASVAAKNAKAQLEQTARAARVALALDKARKALSQLEAMQKLPESAIAECRSAAELELAGGDSSAIAFLRELERTAEELQHARLGGVEALRAAEAARDPEAAERSARRILDALDHFTAVFEDATSLNAPIEQQRDTVVNAEHEAEKTSAATTEIAKVINVNAASSVAGRAASRLPATRAAAQEAAQLVDRSKGSRSLQESVSLFKELISIHRYVVAAASANRAALQVASALEKSLREGNSRENVLSHPEVQNALRAAGNTEAVFMHQEVQRLEEKTAQLVLRASAVQEPALEAHADELSKNVTALTSAAKQTLMQTAVSSDSAQMRLAIGTSAQRLSDARRIVDDLNSIVVAAEANNAKRKKRYAPEEAENATLEHPTPTIEEADDTTRSGSQSSRGARHSRNGGSSGSNGGKNEGDSNSIVQD